MRRIQETLVLSHNFRLISKFTLFMILEPDIGFPDLGCNPFELDLIIVHIEHISINPLLKLAPHSLPHPSHQYLLHPPLIPLPHDIELIIILHQQIEFKQQEGQNKEEEDLCLVGGEHLAGVDHVGYRIVIKEGTDVGDD